MAKQRSILYIRSYSDELKIETVKKLLAIEPINFWQKGESMIVNGINKNKPWVSSNWSYEEPEKEVNAIIEGLTTLLKIFLPYKKELAEIKKMGFETSACIVLHYEHKNLPDLSLDIFCIKSLADLDLELNYDNYLMD